MWADATLGIAELRHLKRCAVVTDHAWARDSVRTVRWMAPTRLKVFPVSQLREAMRWAAS
jgi:hypothetical protein